ILASIVENIAVGVGDAFAAIIKIFSFHNPRKIAHHPSVWSAADGKTRPLKFYPVHHEQIRIPRVARENQEQRMRSTRVRERGCQVCISPGRKWNSGRTQQWSGGGIQSRLDSATQAAGGDAISQT